MTLPPDHDGRPGRESEPSSARPGLWTAIGRGLKRRCPQCGSPKVFMGYLKLAPHCPNCGLPAGSFRTDDAPPYLTLLIVGHIVGPGLLMSEGYTDSSTGALILLWLPVTIVLTLALLPRMKGAVLAVQWANQIKG